MRGHGFGRGWDRLAVVMTFVGLMGIPGMASGQSLKEQIVGTWQLVSAYTEQGGVTRHLHGEKPVGLAMFDRDGYYMSFLTTPDLPKFAANNRLKGTDAEYREVMQGMVAGFGRYTVDGETVTVTWIASTYPNRVGTTEKRTAKIVGDELTNMNPTASSGGTSYQKYVRVK